MELTFDSITTALSLIMGPVGIGFFLTWRWQKAKAQADAEKAKAEAKQQEAEAKSAEVEIAQKVQETYERMMQSKQEEVEDKNRIILELREERDHFHRDRDEMRAQVESLSLSVARLGRKVDILGPFVCGDLQCKLRKFVTISSDGAVRPDKNKKNKIQKGGEPC